MSNVDAPGWLYRLLAAGGVEDGAVYAPYIVGIINETERAEWREV